MQICGRLVAARHLLWHANLSGLNVCKGDAIDRSCVLVIELRIQAETFLRRDPGLGLCEERQVVNGWPVSTRGAVTGSGF